MEEFKAFVKRIRLEMGLTQAELATKLGVVVQTVSNWERGTSEPREDDRKSVSAVYSRWQQRRATQQ